MISLRIPVGLLVRIDDQARGVNRSRSQLIVMLLDRASSELVVGDPKRIKKEPQ